MVLYHAVSTYQMLEVILHRVTIEKENRACILITSDIVRRYPDYQLMLGKYFDPIMTYENYKSETLLADEKVFCTYFETIFQQEGICPEGMDKIYVACCHAGFGIYISRKAIPYVFMEDAAGALSHTGGIREHIKKGNSQRGELLEKYGIYDGTGSNVAARIYNFNANKELQPSVRDINFDVAVELGKLDFETREQLIRTFVDMKKIEVDASCVILLTEHLYNLRLMTWEEQCMMYQLIVDYFLKDKQLIFKTHPDDLLYYNYLFPESRVIRKKFPAEFLPFMLSEMPDCIATVSSTSILGITSIVKNSLVFNQEFSYFKQQYYDLHKYYISLCFILQQKKRPVEVIMEGVNEVIVKNFMQFCFNTDDFKLHTVDDITQEIEDSRKLFIVDRTDKITEDYCLWLETLSSDAVVLFINSDKQFCFYDINHRDIWDNMIPAVIKKRKLREDKIYADLEDEILYIYSKGDFIGMKKVEKELKNTGITITAETFSKDKLRIMVLEGMLEATERRLNYYINKYEGEK